MPQYLILGEVDRQRDRHRAHRADRSRFLVRFAAGPDEVQHGLGARRRPIADAKLEHPDPAVHLVEGGLVQIDWRAPGRATSRFLDHLAAELVVPPEQDRDREPVPQIVVGCCGRRRLHGDRHGFGPGHVDAITHFETFGDLGVGGVEQPARVGRPVRSGEGHDLVDRIPTGDGHGRHSLPGSRGARQSPGCPHSRRLHRPVDRGLASRLQPQADAIVVGGRDGVANLDLLEPHGSGRHVQGHRVALCPRIVTVRAAWSTASTVPWTLTWLSASRGCAADMAGADTNTPTLIRNGRSCFNVIAFRGAGMMGDTGAPQPVVAELPQGAQAQRRPERSHARRNCTSVAAMRPWPQSFRVSRRRMLT